MKSKRLDELKKLSNYEYCHNEEKDEILIQMKLKNGVWSIKPTGTLYFFFNTDI